MSRVKIEVEFLLKASPTIVYSFLTAPACLVRWFCDAVDIEGTTFSFDWQGFIQYAELVMDIEDELLRFEWKEHDYEDEYLEYRISTSPVTNETILTITDFCDDDEVDSQKALWDAQIKTMKAEMGA